MSVILLRYSINDKDKEQLLAEFPQFSLAVQEASEACEQCYLAEIIYGDYFSCQELKIAPQLRWIHVPSPHTDGLCLDELLKRGNILITTTREDHVAQIGEYALSAILAFAKNLFHWKEALPELCREKKMDWGHSMWLFKNRNFLQIGLGQIGTEIAKQAKSAGFKVYGIQDPPSFHPHCHKVLKTQELHSVLPAMDVVSVAKERGLPTDALMKADEYRLMKTDSIFLAFGNGSAMDVGALSAAAQTGKFRGIVIDAHFSKEISSKSPIRRLPNTIITPEIGINPLTESSSNFRTFIYNLRQFVHGNFREMKNLLNYQATESKV